MTRNRNIVLHYLDCLRDKFKYKIHFVAISLILFVSCRSTKEGAAIPVTDVPVDMNEIIVQSPWKNYQASTSKDFDIQHVSLDLRVDLETPLVSGSAELVLIPHYYDQEYLVLDAQKMEINSVLIDGQDWRLYAYDSTQLIIELPRIYSASEQLICKVTYAVNQFSVPAQAGAEDKGGIFLVDYWDHMTPQLWTQGETGFNSLWYPTIDHPNQRYTQKVSLTVADTLTTLSNGALRSQENRGDGKRTDTWVLDQPHAPYLTMIAVGSYEKKAVIDGEVLGNVYGAQTDINRLGSVFSRTSQMIDFYEEKLGIAYPWPVYNQIVVKDYISGAMENTGAVVFLEDIDLTDQEQTVLHFDDYISHELAHHWFGNLVTCESWANLALNESFATYSEQLWNEYFYGQDSADLIAQREHYQYLAESRSKQEDLIRYYYKDADAELFDNHSYSKGARILHMLRLYVGDDAFFDSVSRYLKDNRFKSVEVSDLKKAFESVTGLDLTWFFQQWMLNAGHPILDVTHKVQNDTLIMEVSQSQDISKYPLFYLPLYMDVYWGGEMLSYPIYIEDQRHVFKIPAAGRTLKGIVLDPDFQLVGEINHPKTYEELLHQAMEAQDLLSRYDGYLQLLNSSKGPTTKVIGKMLSEKNELLLTDVLDNLLSVTDQDWLPHEKITNKLVSHPHPQVRASALLLKDEMYSSVDWLEVFSTDVSNYVRGLALEQMTGDLSKTSALQIIDSLKSQVDLNMLLPLSILINENFNEGYSSWYQEKINRSKSSDQLYLLSAYNEFLLGATQVEKLSARTFLSKYAKYHTDSDTRLLAVEGLLLLSDAISIDKVMLEIKAFERNEQLLALYQEFYPQ